MIFCRLIALWAVVSGVSGSGIARELKVQTAEVWQGPSGAPATGAPFATIGEATAVAKPGDTILVGPGIYREAVTLPAGEPGRPITLRSAVRHGAVITGMEPLVLDLRPAEGSPDIWYAPIEGDPQILTLGKEWLERVGPFYHFTPPIFAPPTNADLRDFRAMPPGTFLLRDGVVYLRPQGGRPAPDQPMAQSVRSTGLRLSVFNVVEGFVVEGHEASPAGHAALAAHRGNGNEIRDCVVRRNAFAGVMLQGQKSILADTMVHHNGCTAIISSYGHDLRFEGNETFENNTLGFSTEWYAGGLKVVMQNRLVIAGHRARQEKVGIWLDINCLEAEIVGNTVSDCEVGIFYEISRWGTIADNTITKCVRGIWSYSSDVVIAHNLLQECLEGIVVFGKPRECLFNLGFPDEIIEIPTEVAVRNNHVVGNRIVGCTKAAVRIPPDSATSAGHHSDYNLVMIEENMIHRPVFFHGVHKTIDEWRMIGYDINSVLLGRADSNSVPRGGEKFIPKIYLLESSRRLPGERPWALTQKSTHIIIHRNDAFFSPRTPKIQPLPPVRPLVGYDANLLQSPGPRYQRPIGDHGLSW